MTGVVEGFRWALLGKGDVGPLIWISVIIDLLMLFGGLFYFRRMEDDVFCGCDLMNDVMIRTDFLGKRYRIGGPQASYRTLREAIVAVGTSSTQWLRGGHQAEPNTIWALEDVSFEIRQGETVGIMGGMEPGKAPY